MLLLKTDAYNNEKVLRRETKPKKCYISSFFLLKDEKNTFY